MTVVPGNGEIRVSWDAPKQMTVFGYIVEMSKKDSNVWENAISTSTTTQTAVVARGLTNGTNYMFRVSIMSSTGISEPIYSEEAVAPRGPPDAPTGVVTTAGDEEISLNWVAPEWNGGSAITSYVVSYSSTSGTGPWTVSSSAVSGTSHTVTKLVNGRAYWFRVAAVNVAGTGAAVVTSTSTRPRLSLSAPQNVTGDVNDRSVDLSWDPPLANGGSEITGYSVSYATSATGPWTSAANDVKTLKHSVSGLTNGVGYWFKISVKNAAGATAESVTNFALTPRTVPFAPANLSTRAGAGQIAVTWSAPSFDGGSPITRYVVFYSEEGVDGPWTQSSAGVTGLTHTVTGLTNAIPYWFRVLAVNAAGEGASVVSTLSTTPRTVPDAPTGLTAEVGNGEVVLAWNAPAFDGGSAVTGYTVSYSSEGVNGPWTAVAPAGTSLTRTITGLENGAPYWFKVTATNVAGEGNPIITSSSATPRTVPTAPLDVEALPRNGTAKILWAAPAYDGGNPITDYLLQFRPLNSGTWRTVEREAATTTEAIVGGLANGTTYEFRVSAINEAGTGGASNSAVATPRTVPDAPTNFTTTPDDEQVTLTWVAPAWNGGNRISDYLVQHRTAPNTSWTTFFDGNSAVAEATVTGLTNGVEYQFRVLAVNDAGPGTPTVIVADTPRTVPGAPLSLEAAPDDEQVLLTWEEPTWDGGNPITAYKVEYTTSLSSPWVLFSDAVEEKTATVTGLSNGVAYFFRVSAINEAGPGRLVRTADPTTPRTVPMAPASLYTEPVDAAVQVEWVEPEWDGGAEIGAYSVYYSTDGPQGPWEVNADEAAELSHMAEGLENGRPYWFKITAWNEAGEGAPLVSISETVPRTVPDPPINLRAVSENQEVALTWEAPVWDGGNEISDYVVEYRPSPDGEWTVYEDGTDTATETVVDGLENGTSYDFRVSAVNEAGTGTPSEFSTAIPRTVPDVPTGLVATPDDKKVSLAWQAPAWDGGNDISDYVVQYRISPDQEWLVFDEGVAIATEALVVELANGTLYDFRIAAINEAGTGEYSAVESATPRTVPDAPVNLIATPDNQEVALVWEAPSWDGGNDISDFVVEYRVSPDGEWTVFDDGPGTAVETVVDGLDNGTAYEFRVAATNEAGTGENSAADSATPRTVPDAATALTETPDDKKVILSWQAPEWNGGNAISAYVVSYSSSADGPWTIDTSTASDTTHVVTGLENGTPYWFKVNARNEAGDSESLISATSTTPRTVPEVPRDLETVADNREIALTWAEPAFDGGAPISGYTVAYATSAEGPWTVSVAGLETLSHVVTNLDNGTAYWLKVFATNVAGDGDAITTPEPVTPRTIPDAPTGLNLTPQDQSVSVEWAAPAWDGGSAITGYLLEYRTSPDGEWQTFSGSFSGTGATVESLENGTAYDFRVAAINVAGTGAYSAVETMTPRTVPTAPRNLVTTEDNAEVALAWSTPENDGGDAIQGYKVYYSTSSDGPWTQFGDLAPETSRVVNNLTNGVGYWFKVVAVNDAGDSDPVSTTTWAKPRTVPFAPSNLAATAGDAQVALTWQVPASDGGSEITGYTVAYGTSVDGPWTVSVSDLSGISYTVTGLTNGTAYWFKVFATNVAGDGPPVVTVNSKTPTDAPPTPVLTNVTSTSAGTVTATWQKLSDGSSAPVNSILVRACENSGMSVGCVTQSTTNAAATTLSVSSAKSNTLYYVRVEAINNTGTSVSSVLSVTTAYNATYVNGTSYYTCPSGGTLSGSTCTTTSSYGATLVSNPGYYYCPSGGSLSGSTCYTSTVYGASYQAGYYSCNSGGSLSGSTCYLSTSYAASASYYCPVGALVSGSTCAVYGQTTVAGQCSAIPDKSAVCRSNVGSTYYALNWTYSGGSCTIYCERTYTASVSGYSCPSGGSLSGSVCYTTTTYGATWNPAFYYCPSGGSLSGTTCTLNSSYTATYQSPISYYTCPSGGSLSGSTCTVSSSYNATLVTNPGYYTCPSGGTLSGSTCLR